MAGAVKSVEHFTFVIGSGNRTDLTANVGDLGLSQTVANCVPFVTRRVTSGTDRSVENYQVDAYFATSPDRVVAERDSTVGEITVEVAVVEFDSTRCTVQSGTWQMASATASDTYTIPSAVDLANTFLVFHSYQDSTSSANYDTHLFRGRITGETTITLDRGVGGGTADGRWYVIESDSGDFTVETADIQLASVASNTDTVTAASADLDEMFLIGSWKGPDGGGTTEDDNAIYTLNVTLTENTVTATRAGTTGTVDWSGFLVKMTDGTSVQRGTISAQGATASDPQTITSVTVADSIAIIAGSMGSTAGGSFPGSDTSDVHDAHVALSFSGSPTSTTLDVKHATGGNEADNDISWEVIEWGSGAAGPARRVMVVS